MAITGVLQADFSQFYTAVQRAEVSLKGMEGGAVKVGSALTTMSTGAVGPTNSLRDSVGQVDQALAAAGINVGKYGRGLAEIAEMSGKTVGQLGLLASGASVVAAAMAGWNIGRAIAEFTGLDAAMQKAWATMLGWETAAQGSATATAAFVKHIKDQNDAYAVSSERLAAAQANVRSLNAAQLAGIEIAQKNHATTEQITKAYGITADGLRVLAERQKLAGQAADVHTAALAKQKASAEALDAAYAKLMSDISNEKGMAQFAADAEQMLKVSNNAAAGWIKQQVERKRATDEGIAAEKAYLAEQESLLVKIPEITAAHVAAGEAATVATTATAQGFMAVGQQVQITADAIKEWITLMKYAAQANAINRRNSLYQTTSQAEALAALGGPTVSGASGMVGARGGGGDMRPEVINVVVDGRVLTSIVNDRTAKSLAQAGAV